MKKNPFFLAGLTLTLLIFSCSKKAETDFAPPVTNRNNGGCDTTAVSFATDIKPILQANCYACHSNANFSISGTKLEDYADLKHHVEDGDLLGTITHASGYPAMPQGGPKLSDCNIAKISAWVHSGAQNN